MMCVSAVHISTRVLHQVLVLLVFCIFLHAFRITGVCERRADGGSIKTGL